MAGVAGSEDEDFLDSYYDVVVLSTGLGSSILAAALAKSGKRVLHLDRNDYYGDQTASFSFLKLLDWVERHRWRGGEGMPAEPSTDPNYDLGSVGKAIARAHVREEINQKEKTKNRTAPAAMGAEGVPESDGERDEECGALVPEVPVQGRLVAETEDVRLGSENAAGSVVGEEPLKGAAESAPPPGVPETVEHLNLGVSGRNEVEGRDEVVEEGTKNATGKSADTCGSIAADRVDDDKGKQEMESIPQSSREKENDDVGADRTNDVEENADKRYRSLELRLLPLFHHGCRTRAGAPSDACSQERLEQKAAEDAAAAATAASGRYVRPVAPSHPAWIGRRAPRKVSKGGEISGKRLEDEELHPAFWGYRVEQRPDPAELVRLSRSFNLDLTSKVVLATGAAVDALVSSGVASYLEFKDMPALYMGSDHAPSASRVTEAGAKAGAPPATSSRGLAKPGEALAEDAAGSINGKEGGVATTLALASASASPSPGLNLSRVPCSKADVFGTKLLTPLEKRRLMRFLLFASDWGLQRAGEDVTARNEAGLGRGRSLRRPQNREVASGDFDAGAHAGRPFREFLKSCGLPERVRAMVTHALALLPGGEGVVGGEDAGTREGNSVPSGLDENDATTEEGLEAVCRHLSALGRFGETAFISPLYGMGELPQSFCRMAAVYGAVYVLRRQLKGAIVDRVTGRCVGVVDEFGRPFACGSLVVGEEYFSPSPLTENASHAGETPGSPPGHTVVSSSTPPPPQPDAGKTPYTSANPVQHPPRDDALHGHRFRRQRQRLLRRIVVASGPVSPEGDGRGLCVLPPGLRCIENASAVHVISLDESTAACPGGLAGACVLHLTTTVVSSENDERGQEKEDDSGGVLGRAAKELLEAAGVQEIWSVGFSWDVEGQAASVEGDLPPNMVVCQRPGQELYLHEVFIEAERAFSRLCPGEPFWPPPASNGEDDDQAEMLRAAAASAVIA